MYDNRRSRRVRDERADELLTRIGDLNLPSAQAYVQAKRAQGVKPSTVVNIAHALVNFDRLVDGRRFDTLQPVDLTNVRVAYSRKHTPSSCRHFAIMIRAYYGWANDGECPRPIKQALKRVRAVESSGVVPVTPDEFNALLRAAEEGGDMREVARRICLLWVLWDSGFRVSEALSLRIGNVTFDDEEGATLALPADGVDLKTGERSIYVAECVAALCEWLAIHPLRTARDAPLFASQRRPTRSIYPTEVQCTLARLAKRAGIRHVYPHLFRHTRATRAAASGWVEGELRSCFGWAGKSNMPSHYVRLNKQHMIERVRRDARVAPPPLAQPDQSSLATAVAAAVSATLAQLGVTPALRGRRDDDADGAAPAPTSCRASATMLRTTSSGT